MTATLVPIPAVTAAVRFGKEVSSAARQDIREATCNLLR